MTTDRKNFESHDFRAIIVTAKYPGVAYRLGTWFGTLLYDVRAVFLKSRKPLQHNVFLPFLLNQSDEMPCFYHNFDHNEMIFSVFSDILFFDFRV